MQVCKGQIVEGLVYPVKELRLNLENEGDPLMLPCLGITWTYYHFRQIILLKWASGFEGIPVVVENLNHDTEIDMELGGIWAMSLAGPTSYLDIQFEEEGY